MKEKMPKKDEMKRGSVKRMKKGMEKLERHKGKQGRHNAIGSHEGYTKLK